MAILKNAKKFFGRASGKIDDAISDIRLKKAVPRQKQTSIELKRRAAASEEYDRIIANQKKRPLQETANTKTIEGTVKTNPKITEYDQQTKSILNAENDKLANEIADGREISKKRAEKRAEYTESKSKRMNQGASNGSGNKAQKKIEEIRKRQELQEIAEAKKTEDWFNQKSKHASEPDYYDYDTSKDQEILIKRAEAIEKRESLQSEYNKIANPTEKQALEFEENMGKYEQQASKKSGMTSSEYREYDNTILKNRQSREQELKQLEADSPNYKENVHSELAYEQKVDEINTKHKNAFTEMKMESEKAKIAYDKSPEGIKKAEEAAKKADEAAKKKLEEIRANRNPDGSPKGSAQGAVNKKATEQMKSTMGEQMGKWAPMVVGGGLVIAMANRGGQQTNAELYGQAPAYGGGY